MAAKTTSYSTIQCTTLGTSSEISLFLESLRASSQRLDAPSSIRQLFIMAGSSSTTQKLWQSGSRWSSPMVEITSRLDIFLPGATRDRWEISCCRKSSRKSLHSALSLSAASSSISMTPLSRTKYAKRAGSRITPWSMPPSTVHRYSSMFQAPKYRGENWRESYRCYRSLLNVTEVPTPMWTLRER